MTRQINERPFRLYVCFIFGGMCIILTPLEKKEGAATGGNIWQRLYVDWHWVLLWMSASVAIIRHVADFEHFWRLCSAIMKMSRSAMSVNFDVSVVVMMLVMMNWMDGEYLTFRVQLLSQLTCNKSIRHWSYVGLIMSAGSWELWHTLTRQFSSLIFCHTSTQRWHESILRGWSRELTAF